MVERLKQFILDNQDLINKNTKESWEEIYNKLSFSLTGEFTKTILDAEINDPAEVLGYIPANYLYNSEIANYKIPNNIISIGNGAFYDCNALTSVITSDSVTSIGHYAFSGCYNLTSIVLGDSVTTIGHNAFRDCRALTSVMMGNSVTSINSWAFDLCESLKEIRFKGTKKEAIQCGIGNRLEREWSYGSSIEKIICTDGEIEL